MNELQIFQSPEFGEVRTTVIDGEPWFVAADVCRALAIGNPSMALDRLDDDERTLISIEGASNGKPVNGVNEPGLYSLVLGSRKPEAKAFKRWITHEVIPAIRKTGSYQKPLSQLEILQGSINQLVEQNKRLSRVEMKQEEQDRQMSHINTSIEVLNGVCTEGTKRDRLNAMVRAYANKAGLTYPTAWHKFCEAFNFAFHTNIGLLITNYMKKQAINKKMSTPVYLEAAERLDDALRVAEKMLNSLPGKVARA